MNRKTTFIVVGIILLIIILIIVVPNLKTNNSKNSKELEITKEINAGIPFKWEYEIEDPAIVEFVKSYVVKDENKGAIVGAKVYTNYVFKGIKEGKTHITFKFVSITGEDYPPIEETYTIRVDKELNISLIAVEE